MKVKEFEENLGRENLDCGMELPIYWSLNEDGNVLIDFESMQEEFDEKVRVLKEILEEKDELTNIVNEKMKQIKNERRKKNTPSI